MIAISPSSECFLFEGDVEGHFQDYIVFQINILVSFPFFQLQFTFNIILYWFQVYSIVERQSYFTKCSPDISSTHLAQYMVITVL